MMMLTKEEAADAVLRGLSELIRLGARATTYREFSPTANADDDDDVIKEGRKQVTALREMRERFEDIVFRGII